MTGLANRDYFSAMEIMALERAETIPRVLKPLTSDIWAKDRFHKRGFVQHERRMTTSTWLASG
jgi:hypothetical protein